jgi:hypothetical protein
LPPRWPSVNSGLVLRAIDRIIGDFSVSELNQRCPSAGIDLVRHVLRDEREVGRLMVIGYGRGAKWRRARQGESELGNGSNE